MSYITLKQAKAHLLVEHNEDDLYISDLITVAEDVVRRDLNINSLCEIADENGMLPAGVIQAMLLLIGTMYNNRESISYAIPHIIPHAYNYLLDLYRNYTNTKQL